MPERAKEAGWGTYEVPPISRSVSARGLYLQQHPYVPIVVSMGWRGVLPFRCDVGGCEVRVSHRGKGGLNGIGDMPEFTKHEYKEHRVWVFWR